TGVVQIDILSNHLHEILGTETTSATKAMLRGPLLVIPQEYPHIACRSLDVDMDAGAVTPALVDALVAQLSREVTDRELALRGNYWWTKTYSRRPLTTPQSLSPPLRPNGVYCLLGGLGRIALAMGEVIARSVPSTLVLIGRRDLPPRSEWAE